MAAKGYSIVPRLRALAATGHRPDKLGGYGAAVEVRLLGTAKDALRRHATPDTTVISGMALGWDMAIAEAAVSLDIPFIAAVPFFGQQSAWPFKSQERYHALLKKAQDRVIVCAGGYAAWKMQRRNEYMVDRATEILALWDGTPGGTANCISYAARCRKPIHNVWSDFHDAPR